MMLEQCERQIAKATAAAVVAPPRKVRTMPLRIVQKAATPEERKALLPGFSNVFEQHPVEEALQRKHTAKTRVPTVLVDEVGFNRVLEHLYKPHPVIVDEAELDRVLEQTSPAPELVPEGPAPELTLAVVDELLEREPVTVEELFGPELEGELVLAPKERAAKRVKNSKTCAIELSPEVYAVLKKRAQLHNTCVKAEVLNAVLLSVGR